MKKVVIAEDDIFMREELEDILKKEGYDVFSITSFENTVKTILRESPGLVILDINLPGITGFDICKQLKHCCPVPVLVLTSRDRLKDELHALDLGADEFLTKPCHKERLLARVSNLFRRYEGRANMIEGKGLMLDRQTFTLYFGTQSVVLPENQGKILAALLESPDIPVEKNTLFLALWGTTEYIDENALQVNMTRLKKTLRALNLNLQITAVRGVGYQLLEKECRDV